MAQDDPEKRTLQLAKFDRATASLKAVTDENFESVVLGWQGVVLVQFFARWCGPCHRAGAVVDEVSKQVPEALFCKLDVEESPATAQRLAVKRYPTIILFRRGAIREIYRGERTVDTMAAWVRRYIEPVAATSDL